MQLIAQPYTDKPCHLPQTHAMAVIFKNPAAHAGAYAKHKEQVREKQTKAQTKREAAHARKLLAYWEERSEIDADLRASLEKYHIPQTVEMAKARGGLCAQEIIETVEEMFDCELGPRERKWVVANIVAQDHFNRRTSLSQRYCPEVAQYVLDRMCAGEQLRNICRDPHMPYISRFLAWVVENPDLKEQYSRAQEIMVMSMMEDAMPLVDNVRVGVITTHKSDGTVDITTTDMLGRSKLQWEARRWLASKIMRHTYGDVDKELEGGDNTVHIKTEGGLPDVLQGELMSVEEREKFNRDQYAAVQGNKAGSVELGKGLTVGGGLPDGQGLPDNPWLKALPPEGEQP